MGPVAKTAGPYRLATELRLNGFTVQVIDISRIFDLKQLYLILLKFMGPNTLWIGLSNTFMTQFLGTPWQLINTYNTSNKPDTYIELLEKFKEFKSLITKKFSKVKFIYGDAGAREDITPAGYIKFSGYVDTKLIEFTKECRADRNFITETSIYQKEFTDFCSSSILWTENDLFMPQSSLPVEISRGCIFKCTFCRYPLNGKKKFDYIKDPEVLYRELMRNYELFGVTNYLFTDDTYNDSLYKIKQIQSVIERLPFTLNFSTYIRLDLLIRFPDMAKILADSGLMSCFVGLETRDPEDAKFVGKGVPFEKQIEYLHEIKGSSFKNIAVQGGFILGLPNDNIDKLHSLIEWFMSDENPLDCVTTNPLKIMPVEHESMASDIDRNYEKYGYKIVVNDNGRQWVNEKNGLSQNQLYELQDQFYGRLKERNKTYSFVMMDFLNLGMTKEELLSMTINQRNAKYNHKKMLNEAQQLYLKKLLSLKTDK